MSFDRRAFLAFSARVGLSSTLFPGALYTLAAQAQSASAAPDKNLPKITPEMIDQAAALAGITIAADQKAMMLDGLNEQRAGYAAIRKLQLPNSVPPAYIFDPLPPGATVNTERRDAVYSAAVATMPANLEDLAFATIPELADLVRRKKVSSLDLTQMYIARLRKYDPVLHFAITITEDRALAQAREADAEIAAGKYRGPLHGLPWGAKDLLSVKGYPTTWGAGGFEKQTIDTDATVVQRLDAAGAVLTAKTTLGALAMGDKWFGGRTRNPWNPKSRIERLFGGLGRGHIRRMRGLCYRLRNAGLHLFSFDTLRRDRSSSHLRIRAAHGRDGAELDDGQARPHLPRRRRLRYRAHGNLRPRRPGPAPRATPPSTGMRNSIGNPSGLATLPASSSPTSHPHQPKSRPNRPRLKKRRNAKPTSARWPPFERAAPTTANMIWPRSTSCARWA